FTVVHRIRCVQCALAKHHERNLLRVVDERRQGATFVSRMFKINEHQIEKGALRRVILGIC
ncbi:MAG: hypothetical protein WB681_03560, partial [Candidatus Cybelea sp.]